MILNTFRQRLCAALARILKARRSYTPADTLQAALASLPEPSRTVYLLHARDGILLRDVARLLDLAPSDVERHLASALAHLDRQIGAISPAGTVASDSVER